MHYSFHICLYNKLCSLENLFVVNLGNDRTRIQALEDELARLKAQMAQLSLEQIQKSESNGVCVCCVLYVVYTASQCWFTSIGGNGSAVHNCCRQCVCVFV